MYSKAVPWIFAELIFKKVFYPIGIHINTLFGKNYLNLMIGGTEHDICHSIQNQWYLHCNFSRKDFGFKIRLFSSCDKNIYINTQFYQDLFFNITCKRLIICHLFTIIFELIISLFSVWSREPYVQFGFPPSLDPHLIFSHNKG